MQAAKHPYTFPDELWLEILVDLKYSDLVKFMRVCKNFKKLIKSTQFDSALFRTPLSKAKPIVRGMRIELHPAMDKVDFVCDNLETALEPFKLDSNYTEIVPQPTTKEIESYPFYKEFATDPPCTSINVQLAGGGVVKNAKGVTVANVIKKAIALWSKKPTKRIAREIFEFGDHGAETVEGITYMDSLGDHRFFEGWQYGAVIEPVAKGGFQVVLDPGGFGS